MYSIMLIPSYQYGCDGVHSTFPWAYRRLGVTLRVKGQPLFVCTVPCSDL